MLPQHPCTLLSQPPPSTVRAARQGVPSLVPVPCTTRCLPGYDMGQGEENNYFHTGERGYHSAWDSRCFNYRCAVRQVVHASLPPLAHTTFCCGSSLRGLGWTTIPCATISPNPAPSPARAALPENTADTVAGLPSLGPSHTPGTGTSSYLLNPSSLPTSPPSHTAPQQLGDAAPPAEQPAVLHGRVPVSAAVRLLGGKGVGEGSRVVP